MAVWREKVIWVNETMLRDVSQSTKKWGKALQVFSEVNIHVIMKSGSKIEIMLCLHMMYLYWLPMDEGDTPNIFQYGAEMHLAIETILLIPW